MTMEKQAFNWVQLLKDITRTGQHADQLNESDSAWHTFQAGVPFTRDMFTGLSYLPLYNRMINPAYKSPISDYRALLGLGQMQEDALTSVAEGDWEHILPDDGSEADKLKKLPAFFNRNKVYGVMRNWDNWIQDNIDSGITGKRVVTNNATGEKFVYDRNPVNTRNLPRNKVQSYYNSIKQNPELYKDSNKFREWASRKLPWQGTLSTSRQYERFPVSEHAFNQKATNALRKGPAAFRMPSVNLGFLKAQRKVKDFGRWLNNGTQAIIAKSPVAQRIGSGIAKGYNGVKDIAKGVSTVVNTGAKGIATAAKEFAAPIGSYVDDIVSGGANVGKTISKITPTVIKAPIKWVVGAAANPLTGRALGTAGGFMQAGHGIHTMLDSSQRWDDRTMGAFDTAIGAGTALATFTGGVAAAAPALTASMAYEATKYLNDKYGRPYADKQMEQRMDNYKNPDGTYNVPGFWGQAGLAAQYMGDEVKGIVGGAGQAVYDAGKSVGKGAYDWTLGNSWAPWNWGQKSGEYLPISPVEIKQAQFQYAIRHVLRMRGYNI